MGLAAAGPLSFLGCIRTGPDASLFRVVMGELSLGRSEHVSGPVAVRVGDRIPTPNSEAFNAP